MFDSGLMLLEEIRCLSLSGINGFKSTIIKANF